MSSFYVKAIWDADAEVFYSETDVPGLTVEAPTIAAFHQLVMRFAPEMLAENAGLHGDVQLRFSVEQDLFLAVA